MPSASAQPAKSMRISDDGGAMHVSPGTGAFCFAGDAGARKVGLHDLRSGESLLHHALTGVDLPTAAATAHDAGKAAFGTRSGALYVWDVQFPSVLESFVGGSLEAASDNTPANVGDEDAVAALAWHPRGHALAAGTKRGALAVWDMVLGAPAFRIEGAHEGGVRVAAWTGHGRMLLTAGADGELRVWNARHGRVDAIVDGVGAPDMWHAAPLTALDALGDMSRVAITGAEDGTVFLSVLKPGETDGCGVFCKLPTHEGAVCAVRIAPSSSAVPLRAATAGADSRVRLFDMERKLPMANFKHIGAPRGAHQLEFSDDANALFSAAGPTVVAWDSRAALDERPEFIFEADADVTSFCIADSGASLILGCEDGVLRLFDMRYPGGGAYVEPELASMRG